MLLVAFLFLFKNNSSSQNFIQNGGFEITTNLNCSTGPISNVNNWSIISSPDYFLAACNGIGNSGMPNNKFGSCFPISGSSYIGIATIGYPYETKEYIYQQLATPLIAGKSYHTSFFLSKADRTRIATEKIGASFSVSAPVAPGNTYVNAIPQVENQSGYLTDTVNWVEINGYFTAQGGEQYITIGNFNSNANTDTLYTGANNPFFADPGTAYYYIDSVSLYDSLDYVTNIKELKNEAKFNLYPNPSNGKLYLEYDLKHKEDAVMNIFDISGKLVSSYNLQQAIGKIEINEQNLMNGVYYYSIVLNGKVTTTHKIIIIK